MPRGNGVKPQFEDEGLVRVNVADDGRVTVMEEWGEEVTLPGTLERVNPGEIVAVFQAYVRAAKIMVRGELQITLGIPFQHKYMAMAVTDQLGVMFDVEVRRPPRKKGRGTEELEEGFDPWELI